jgi:hypothetical protein
MKEEFNKHMKSPEKKSNRIPGIKKCLKSNKNIFEVTPVDWNKWKTEFQGSKTK